MPRETLVLHGYREFLRATARAEPETKRKVRSVLREAGEGTRRSAVNNFSPIDQRSAAGYKTRVRQRGIAVEQSLRKTTGQRPDYGSLQMRRALLPSLMENSRELERDLERAIDKIADHFERKP